MKSDDRQCRARRADARCQRDARHEGHHRAEHLAPNGDRRIIDWMPEETHR